MVMVSDEPIYPIGAKHPDPCKDCGGDLLLRAGEHMFYGCVNFPLCEGSAGAHPSGIPMGRAGNREIKTMRSTRLGT